MRLRHLPRGICYITKGARRLQTIAHGERLPSICQGERTMNFDMRLTERLFSVRNTARRTVNVRFKAFGFFPRSA